MASPLPVTASPAKTTLPVLLLVLAVRAASHGLDAATGADGFLTSGATMVLALPADTKADWRLASRRPKMLAALES